LATLKIVKLFSIGGQDRVSTLSRSITMTKTSKYFSKFIAVAILCSTASLVASTKAEAALLVNGGFEDSTSQTVTPTGWRNIGHSDGVITYALFSTPVYEGLNFYDLGGFGDPFGPIGDGIAQDFATTIGQTYQVTFGLSSENQSGTETLRASAGSAFVDYVLNVTSDELFLRPFTTQSFNFVASSNLTTLSFIHTAGSGGNNDPLIDGVSVVQLGQSQAVPEPFTVIGTLVGGTAAVRMRKKLGASNKA
jgi:hypothetical protein